MGKKIKSKLTVIETKRGLLMRLKALGPVDKEQRNAVVCALVGHSRIQTACLGYFNCGRCGEEVGDSLASSYPEAANVVIVGHNCARCRKNYSRLTWRDKIFAPEPF